MVDNYLDAGLSVSKYRVFKSVQNLLVLGGGSPEEAPELLNTCAFYFFWVHVCSSKIKRGLKPGVSLNLGVYSGSSVVFHFKI